MTIDPEEGLMCGSCGAILWIATQEGQHTLMRLGGVEIDECIQCEKIHEVVR